MSRTLLYKGFVTVIGVILLWMTFTTVSTLAEVEMLKVLIGFEDLPDPGLVEAIGGEVKYTFHLIPVVAAELPVVAIEKLAKNPKISYIEDDVIYHAIGEVLPWGVDRIDAELVHPYNRGTGVAVSIIDTGIDYTHPDLDANFFGGYDFVNLDPDPMDDNGHGTFVSGIVAAESNGLGVIGVAPEGKLYGVKVLDSTGSGYASDVIAGIQWSVDNFMEIINMSLGSNSDSQSLHDACDAAYLGGLLLVAAAGNDGNPAGNIDTVDYPARYTSVIAVGATNQDDTRPSWSNTGPDLELCAPGVNIYSTYPGGYATGSGTSASSPHVAGTSALVMVSYSTLDNVGVRQRLIDTADDLGSVGFDWKYGWGIVDANEAAPNTTPTHDVAVTFINVSSEVGKGDIVPVDVTVTNEGTYGETFTLTLTDTTDLIIIGSGIVSLVSGGSQTLTFNWNTSNSTLGNHILKAEASVVAGETDTADNIKTTTVNVVEKKTLTVSVTTDKSIYKIGEWVYITVKVTDNLGVVVAGASVHVELTTANGKKYAGDGTTDTNGVAKFRFRIKKSDGIGTYSVTAAASKAGYVSGTGSTTFTVN